MKRPTNKAPLVAITASKEPQFKPTQQEVEIIQSIRRIRNYELRAHLCRLIANVEQQEALNRTRPVLRLVHEVRS